MEEKPTVLALVGPTGAGKTRTAIALCGALNAEIVSMDSMQIYRGMDIGTAKPTPEERAQAVHHMIDVADPKEFLEAAINTPRLETVPDQWTSQILARILVHHRVILVSDLVDPALVTGMHMELATSFEEALARAFEIEGPEAKVAVIRDGLSVIVK